MSPSIDYNDDELEAPLWLNADYLTKVLSHCEKDDSIEVRHFKLSPGTAKGDHYASIMFRAVVNYKQQSVEKVKSMIIKTMPESEGNKKEMIGDSQIFETEIGMYTEIIPRFESILRSIGDDTVLGANCIYHSLEPKKVIIFEDLCTLGYEVLRDRQPDIDEIKLAYLKLAKLHAISFKLIKEQPKLFDPYCHSFLTVTSMRNSEFIVDGLENFINALESSSALKEFKDYFESLRGKLIPSCLKSLDEFRKNPQEDAYYVLCHGDFHAKNLMFKRNKENGKAEDCMLLDFQMCNVGPIGSDVIYSSYMLLDDELRLNKKEELIYYYFSNFVDTLMKIGFEGKLPNLVNFREQLMDHKHLDLFLISTFLPFWYGFRDGVNDPEQLLMNNDVRKSLYKSKAFLQEMELLLPKYLHVGYFEDKC